MKFRIRGGFGFLNRTDGNHTDLYPATARSEINTEINTGYELIEGLTLSVGYHGIYGNQANHIGFAGLTSDMRFILWNAKP